MAIVDLMAKTQWISVVFSVNFQTPLTATPLELGVFAFFALIPIGQVMGRMDQPLSHFNRIKHCLKWLNITTEWLQFSKNTPQARWLGTDGDYDETRWRDDETTHEQLLRCSPRLQIWDLWNNLSGAQSAKHGQYLCRWKPPCFLELPQNDPEEFRQNDSSQRGKRSARQCLSHRGCPSFGTFPSDTASWDYDTNFHRKKTRGKCDIWCRTSTDLRSLPISTSKQRSIQRDVRRLSYDYGLRLKSVRLCRFTTYFR